MAGGTGDLTLITAVDQLGRFLGVPGDKSRINLRHYGLFCTKTTADPGF